MWAEVSLPNRRPVPIFPSFFFIPPEEDPLSFPSSQSLIDVIALLPHLHLLLFFLPQEPALQPPAPGGAITMEEEEDGNKTTTAEGVLSEEGGEEGLTALFTFGMIADVQYADRGKKPCIATTYRPPRFTTCSIGTIIKGQISSWPYAFGKPHGVRKVKAWPVYLMVFANCRSRLFVWLVNLSMSCHVMYYLR